MPQPLAVTGRKTRLRGLYAVTPDLADTPALVARVEAAIRGGARAIQYRNKTASAMLRGVQAAALSRACNARDVLFIVNDDVELARAVGAHGVHLGEDDADLAAARAVLGPATMIGVSCYDDAQRARALVAAGADYVAFGSFFPSAVKPAARRADIAVLARAESLGVPVVAIGGITASNARGLVVAGADALAVISAVFAHDDVSSITRAAAAIAACFERPAAA